MNFFKSYFKHASDVELHTNKAVKLKTYAQSWLYVIMHLMNAWRSGDIIYGLPKIEFYDLDFINLEYFEKNKLTRAQAHLIINQYHIIVGKIKYSNTSSLNKYIFINNYNMIFVTTFTIEYMYCIKLHVI